MPGQEEQRTVAQRQLKAFCQQTGQTHGLFEKTDVSVSVLVGLLQSAPENPDSAHQFFIRLETLLRYGRLEDALTALMVWQENNVESSVTDLLHTMVGQLVSLGNQEPAPNFLQGRTAQDLIRDVFLQMRIAHVQYQRALAASQVSSSWFSNRKPWAQNEDVTGFLECARDMTQMISQVLLPDVDVSVLWSKLQAEQIRAKDLRARLEKATKQGAERGTKGLAQTGLRIEDSFEELGASEDTRESWKEAFRKENKNDFLKIITSLKDDAHREGFAFIYRAQLTEGFFLKHLPEYLKEKSNPIRAMAVLSNAVEALAGCDAQNKRSQSVESSSGASGADAGSDVEIESVVSSVPSESGSQPEEEIARTSYQCALDKAIEAEFGRMQACRVRVACVSDAIVMPDNSPEMLAIPESVPQDTPPEDLVWEGVADGLMSHSPRPMMLFNAARTSYVSAEGSVPQHVPVRKICQESRDHLLNSVIERLDGESAECLRGVEKPEKSPSIPEAGAYPADKDIVPVLFIEGSAVDFWNSRQAPVVTAGYQGGTERVQVGLLRVQALDKNAIDILREKQKAERIEQRRANGLPAELEAGESYPRDNTDDAIQTLNTVTAKRGDLIPIVMDPVLKAFVRDWKKATQGGYAPSTAEEIKLGSGWEWVSLESGDGSRDPSVVGDVPAASSQKAKRSILQRLKSLLIPDGLYNVMRRAPDTIKRFAQQHGRTLAFTAIVAAAVGASVGTFGLLPAVASVLAGLDIALGVLTGGVLGLGIATLVKRVWNKFKEDDAAEILTVLSDYNRTSSGAVLEQLRDPLDPNYVSDANANVLDKDLYLGEGFISLRNLIEDCQSLSSTRQATVGVEYDIMPKMLQLMTATQDQLATIAETDTVATLEDISQQVNTFLASHQSAAFTSIVLADKKYCAQVMNFIQENFGSTLNAGGIEDADVINILQEELGEAVRDLVRCVVDAYQAPDGVEPFPWVRAVQNYNRANPLKTEESGDIFDPLGPVDDSPGPLAGEADGSRPPSPGLR